MRLGDWSWIWSNEERHEDLKSAYQLCLWETPVGSQGVPAEIKQGTLSLREKDIGYTLEMVEAGNGVYRLSCVAEVGM